MWTAILAKCPISHWLQVYDLTSMCGVGGDGAGGGGGGVTGHGWHRVCDDETNIFLTGSWDVSSHVYGDRKQALKAKAPSSPNP